MCSDPRRLEESQIQVSKSQYHTDTEIQEYWEILFFFFLFNTPQKNIILFPCTLLVKVHQ